MKTIETLKEFLTDDQILEVAAIAAENRNLEAARLLQCHLGEDWNIKTVKALEVVKELLKELGH